MIRSAQIKHNEYKRKVEEREKKATLFELVHFLWANGRVPTSSRAKLFSEAREISRRVMVSVKTKIASAHHVTFAPATLCGAEFHLAHPPSSGESRPSVGPFGGPKWETPFSGPAPAQDSGESARRYHSCDAWSLLMPFRHYQNTLG